MSTTLSLGSRPAGHAQRLGYLERMADDLAQAWFAGYVVNLGNWPAMSDRCLHMHIHFRTRSAAFAKARLAAVARRIIASQRVARA